MPDYLVPLDYAATGTTITRITDQMAFGVDDRVLKHDYSRRAAWNADGSRLLLVNPYPALIFDASDFTRWETHQTPVDALWSNTDPATLFGLTQGTVLVRYSIVTRIETPLRVFNGYSHLSIGGGEGVQSDDDRRLVLIGERTGGVDVILYDLVDDEVRILPIDGAIWEDEDIDWAGISPSGDYLVVKFNRDEAGERGFDVYDSRSLARLRRLLPGSEAHADMGLRPGRARGAGVVGGGQSGDRVGTAGGWRRARGTVGRRGVLQCPRVLPQYPSTGLVLRQHLFGGGRSDRVPVPGHLQHQAGRQRAGGALRAGILRRGPGGSGLCAPGVGRAQPARRSGPVRQRLGRRQR